MLRIYNYLTHMTFIVIRRYAKKITFFDNELLKYLFSRCNNAFLSLVIIFFQIKHSEHFIILYYMEYISTMLVLTLPTCSIN